MFVATHSCFGDVSGKGMFTKGRLEAIIFIIAIIILIYVVYNCYQFKVITNIKKTSNPFINFQIATLRLHFINAAYISYNLHYDIYKNFLVLTTLILTENYLPATNDNHNGKSQN